MKAFIIVATDKLRLYLKKDMNSFDVLAEPSGKCLTFDSKSEALTFLHDVVSENEWNNYYMQNSNIHIDRLH